MSSGLNKMSVKQLKAYCKENKIKGYSKLKKSELISHIMKQQIPETIKEPTPKPVTPIQEPISEAPLPAFIDTDASGFEDMVPQEELKEDEVLSDLDELIENYDDTLKQQEEERIRKEEEERKRMKEELLKKLKDEQEKITAEELTNKVIKEATQELKSEKPKTKPIKRKFKKPIRKQFKPVIKQSVDLSTISIEDLIAEANRRGYNMMKRKVLDTSKIEILRNTCDDLDMLSDDEE